MRLLMLLKPGRELPARAGDGTLVILKRSESGQTWQVWTQQRGADDWDSRVVFDAYENLGADEVPQYSDYHAAEARARTYARSLTYMLRDLNNYAQEGQ